MKQGTGQQARLSLPFPVPKRRRASAVLPRPPDSLDMDEEIPSSSQKMQQEIEAAMDKTTPSVHSTPSRAGARSRRGLGKTSRALQRATRALTLQDAHAQGPSKDVEPFMPGLATQTAADTLLDMPGLDAEAGATPGAQPAGYSSSDDDFLDTPLHYRLAGRSGGAHPGHWLSPASSSGGSSVGPASGRAPLPAEQPPRARCESRFATLAARPSVVARTPPVAGAAACEPMHAATQGPSAHAHDDGRQACPLQNGDNATPGAAHASTNDAHDQTTAAPRFSLRQLGRRVEVPLPLLKSTPPHPIPLPRAAGREGGDHPAAEGAAAPRYA